MIPIGSQSALFEKEAAQPQFRRARDGDTAGNRPLPFDIVFADNKAKLAELQLADWGARPVELSDRRPQQANQAFDILKKKFFCDGGRTQVGSGDENVGLRFIRL